MKAGIRNDDPEVDVDKIEEEELSQDDVDDDNWIIPEDKRGLSLQDKFYSKRSNFYAWTVLGVLLLLRIAVIWQRKSLNYIYGFQGDGS